MATPPVSKTKEEHLFSNLKKGESPPPKYYLK